MTDISAQPTAGPLRRRVDTTSPEAQAAVRRRYRSEARFRTYGLLAILTAAVFLVVLLIDIGARALPAFTTTSLQLNVAVPSDLVPADQKNNPAAIRGADFLPVMREALKTAIPGVQGRGPERTLLRLLSPGAPDDLRERLAANPSLIGTTLKVPLLLSATADLYFKGAGTPINTRSSRGAATPSGTTGTITVSAPGNDFSENLVTVKLAVAERAQALAAEAERTARSSAPNAAERANELRAEAAAMAARAKDTAAAETLDSRLPSLLVEINGGLVKVSQLAADRIEGDVLLPLASTNEAKASDWRIVTYVTPESSRKIGDQEVAFLERFKANGQVEKGFNWRFFTSGDSREPELAGIRGAIVGTALTLLVTLVLCVPVGVAAAIYLEEFAPKNRFTDIIEVNINNLAAVPSIVFGLLGLAMFLNFFGLPRSAPLVGGLVLALLVLPTIIIASRAALKAVPPSIKEAALGVGASHQQAIFHHVLPLAMPGIMTGTIIGMAHALGETAPLLMIGMVAFIVDVPTSVTDAATVLPVQIFLWSDLPELAFKAKTAGAIVVLLVFLFVMNGTAIWLRKRFERRW
ncbi:phosphate ABC transporter permease PstA [Hyphomicrobium sp. CS1BSMeth3]|uniref:phosphate ABC transporter permease PstA n=1 Tax=Hyphomicrobium sp. CS1BSMeth3 TaxID=1892844 RepID=UPI00093049DB|nr:phosphate ABC transporter permease PstA [Hyphomicrobium sp. CS1BSMeth3]